MPLIKSSLALAEKGLLPDSIVRTGIRKLVEKRLQDIKANSCEAGMSSLTTFTQAMSVANIAEVPELANAQHYEVPAEFFHQCLGSQRKYSSCFWMPETKDLVEAEILALKQTCDHADIQDGQHILELGCGWGSLSLWMATHYPKAQITGVSNSNSQREYITEMAKSLGITNLNIITADMNVFEAPSQYDRVVSVEMFEHMRNYQTLLNRISKWMKQDAKLFVHIFCHRYVMYPFETEGDNNWMGKYFFTGGIMPSADTLLHFQEDMSIQKRWLVSGEHYEKTSNHWLANQDANRVEIMQIMKSTYGEADAKRWFNRWRIFWLSCAELFGLEDGNEWLVAHYLFCKR